MRIASRKSYTITGGVIGLIIPLLLLLVQCYDIGEPAQAMALALSLFPGLPIAYALVGILHVLGCDPEGAALGWGIPGGYLFTMLMWTALGAYFGRRRYIIRLRRTQ